MSPRARLVPIVAVVHALGLIGFLSWRFGGMEPSSRSVAGWLVAAAPVITAWAWTEAAPGARRRFVRFGLPLLGIALLVLLGAMNPYMQLLSAEGQPVGLIEREYHHYLPS